MVHTAAKSSIDMFETLQERFPSDYTIETCPQYLTMTVESPCGILGKVNPPIHFSEDVEALWEGIRKGVVMTIGTDNVPAYLAQKQAKGKDLWGAALGFSTPGLILPVLVSEGYHKRGIPLWRLARVSSTNTARKFLLPGKGEIKVGYDADLALVDLEWEREITPDLFGCSDYSIYAGMTFRGWPRYTISRGEIIQKDGRITADTGRGRYIYRSL
jgi:dihydroorotase-like cyclic amidohydrolase